jgi:type I site-specific restriction endonuclease
MYNEADTRAKLSDPKLHTAGWDERHIRRDHPFIKADYLLCYNPALPLAVVEAKEEVLDAAVGLPQAMRYARRRGRQQLNLISLPSFAQPVESDCGKGPRNHRFCCEWAPFAS